MEINFRLEIRDLFLSNHTLIDQPIKLNNRQVGKIVSVQDNDDGSVQCIAQIDQSEEELIKRRLK